MTDINELVEIIKSNGGTASIEEIIKGYQQKHPMVILSEHKSIIQNTLLSNHERVFFDDINRVWTVGKCDNDTDKPSLSGISQEIDNQISVLENLKNTYPSLQYEQRGKSRGKMNDINIIIDDKRIMTLNSKPNERMGRFYTKFVTPEEHQNAILEEGRTTDFFPDRTNDVYRYRPKWDQKYWKAYFSYDQLKSDIEHIIYVFRNSNC